MKIGKIMMIVVVFLCGSFLYSMVTLVTAAELKTYSFGAFWPMTGSQSWYGRVMSHGAITAVDEIIAAGGVAGYKLRLVITDFKEGQADLAVSGTLKAINVDKIAFTLGSFTGTCLSVQPIAVTYKVLMLNGGGAGAALQNKPMLYNNRMNQNILGGTMMKYLWDKKGCRKLAMMIDNEASGITSREMVYKPLWKKWGGSIVAEEMNQVGSVDVSGQMARIKQGKPDLLILHTAGETSGYAVKGAREMGITCPIMINEFFPVNIKITGKELATGIFTCNDSFDRTSSDPALKNFVTSYEKRWGDQAELYAANFYDGVYVLVELIKRVVAKGGNPLDGSQLEAAIWDNPNFKTVYGETMKFKKDGTVRKMAAITEIVKGEFRIVEKKMAED